MVRSRPTVLVLGLLLSTPGFYFFSRYHDRLVDPLSLVASRGTLFAWLHGEPADEVPRNPPYGAIVAAGRSTDDLQWMNVFAKDWMIYPYNTDKPDNDDPRLRIPENKGNEAMVYLSFIIDNYADLPWLSIFTHGHIRAWHQEEHIVPLIHSLNLTATAREGYVNLRCDWYPTCPAEIRPKYHDAIVWGPGEKRKQTEAAIAGNWRLIFDREVLPDTIASQCCAQFAVTRRAIRRRPVEDYKRMRQWLLSSLTINDVSGRVFEKLWAYIFTGESVHCPPPQKCACEWFGRCGKHSWQQPPPGLPQMPGWP